MKKSVFALAASTGLALTTLLAGPAQAMGSGNNYADFQVGVSYTVYQPTYTNGLKQISFNGDAGDAGCSAEETFSAVYGSSKGRQFSVTEGNPICQDIGQGPTVYTTKIKGAKATIQAYCPPPGNGCTLKDVAKYGGHLSVIFPPGNSYLRHTQVWVETLQGRNSVGGSELVKIAQRMYPINQ
jgi:hypothetical protein